MATQLQDSFLKLKWAVAYLRVSTEEQTPQNQELYLKEWALTHGYHIAKSFTDAATSGKTPALERQGFSAMMEYIKNSRVDAVLVYELSRVGRSFYDTLEAIKAVDKYAPLLTCSKKEEFLQTTEPSVRKLLISIFSWVSEREREMLIERTKAGLARARAEGKQIGRPKMQLDQNEIERMMVAGWSKTKIAKRLGVSRTKLFMYLSDVTHGIPCGPENLSKESD